MEVSKLQLYSIGIVALNKALDTDIIEATPTETMPMLDGELTDHSEQYQAKGVDADQASYQVEVQSTATIKAKWLPINSMNRKTPPDVRRGERVMLYRFADTDQFFWATLWDDLKLRKLETVIYVFSGTRVEDAPVNGDNYYFLEISTHSKVVHFHTSKADAEPFGYDIQINTKDGVITITDDIGNVFFLNSKERQLQMINADGTYMEVNKKDINQFCSGTLTQQAGTIIQRADKMTISIGGELSETAGSGEISVGGHTLTAHQHDDPQGGKVSPPSN